MAIRLLACVVLVCTAAPALSATGARDTYAETIIQTGMASYYSHRFEGRRTASGDTFRNDALTAAHSTLPFGTLVRVTSARGHSVDVRITDRLPSRHAIIDLTQRAAAQLDMIRAGKERVTVQVLEWGRDAQQALKRVARDTPVLGALLESEPTAD